MALNGQQKQILHTALLAAFSSKSALEQMLSHKLDIKLNEIVPDGNLSDVVFRLIDWVSRRDREWELVKGALEENPDNPILQNVEQELRNAISVKRNGPGSTRRVDWRIWGVVVALFILVVVFLIFRPDIPTTSTGETPTAAHASATIPSISATTSPTTLANVITIAGYREIITPLNRPKTVLLRDGGASALIGDHILWTFGSTWFFTRPADGFWCNCRSSTAALAKLGASEPYSFTELLDSNDIPYQFLPFSEEERLYNEQNQSVNTFYSLWPQSVVAVSPDRAAIFYKKVREGPALLEVHNLGSGVAFLDVSPAMTATALTAVRAPGLLFTADREAARDPLFSTGAVVAKDESQDRQYVFVYACEDIGKPEGVPCRVARVPLDSVAVRSAYEVWDGAQWVNTVGQAQPVLDAGTELSVSWNPYLKQFLAVYSDVHSGHVWMRTAPEPQGPWSAPVLAFVGRPIAQPNPLVHNRWAIEHPELASDGGRNVIVSYFHPLPGLNGEILLVEVTFK